MKRLALLGALLATGCGSSAAHHAGSQPAPAVAEAQASHEYPPPAPRQERVTGASLSAAAAVASFATAYINWTAGTVSADMRELAARSIGQARAATELAAAQTAGDYELHRDGIGNSGTVEAIAPLRGAANEYVVVTQELTTATASTAYQGLNPAWHVAVATVSQVAAGEWVVSGWQPES